MKWITRRNIKADRVACPWLIRRFVDPDAEFLFVEEAELVDAARRENAAPFDAPRLPEVKLNHRDARCTFEAIIEDHHLNAPGLAKLALIVRAADIKGQEHVAPEGVGLRVIAEGLACIRLSADDRLDRKLRIGEALYERALLKVK